MGSMRKGDGGNRHLVAMPYPGRGHINPMVNLCKLIASKSPNLQVTIVVTEEWHGFLTVGAESQPSLLPPNLSYGVIPQVIPSELGRAKDFPNFIESTLTKLQAPFEQLLDRLHPPPTSIVYDTYLFWAVEVANRRNLTVAAFCTVSASMFTLLCHFDLLLHNGHYPLQTSERGSEVVDYIPGLPPTAIHDFPTMFDGDGAIVLHRVLESIRAIEKAEFLLLTSIPDLEGAAIDALESKFSPSSTTVLPIGPMIPYFTPQSDSDHHYLRWLDSQPTGSVLYVSLGSFLSTSAAQMDEIVAGITNSGVRYLWVTRGEEWRFKEDERGCLVRWCDQLTVLSHRAVGGFWSHCGWNSTSEAAYAGVPVLAYPLFWDQLLNGKTVVEEWKMGRRVRRSGGQELVTREEIAETVRGFMDDAGEGRRELVESAQRVSVACRRAMLHGGSASFNLDNFLTRISALH